MYDTVYKLYLNLKKGKKQNKQKERPLQASICQKNGQPGKIEQILKKYNLPRLNQEEIENMNRPMTSTKIETMILKLPKSKS